MSEADLQREILRMAKRYDVLAHHCNDSRRCIGLPGLPDLYLLGKDGGMFAELKDYGKSPVGNQVTWRYRLQMAGVSYRLWRPGDLEEIEEVISGL